MSYFLDNIAMYLIIIFGLFSFGAYLVVTGILYRTQRSFGPWILYSIISILFILSEFAALDVLWHRRFVAAIMFFFFAAALFRYWDAIEMGQ